MIKMSQYSRADELHRVVLESVRIADEAARMDAYTHQQKTDLAFALSTVKAAARGISFTQDQVYGLISQVLTEEQPAAPQAPANSTTTYGTKFPVARHFIIPSGPSVNDPVWLVVVSEIMPDGRVVDYMTFDVLDQAKAAVQYNSQAHLRMVPTLPPNKYVAGTTIPVRPSLWQRFWTVVGAAAEGASRAIPRL